MPLVWTFFAHRTRTAVPLTPLAQTPGIWWLTTILMFIALELVILGFAPAGHAKIDGFGHRRRISVLR